jgi:hypothetical protein
MDKTEIALGLKMEKSEHHLPATVTRKLVMDHLKKDPQAYSKHSESAEKDPKEKEPNHETKEPTSMKKKEGDSVDKAFEAWTSLKESSTGPTKVSDEYFPSVSLSMDKAPELKAGDEIEIEFKCLVKSIEHTDEGTGRVRLELKEAKFD